MLAWLTIALAQTSFEGPVVADGVAASVDVTDSVLQVLQAQARHDAFLSYLGGTLRWAPGEFVLADGQRLGGNLARWQLGGGAGIGKPSAIGASAGFAFDAVRETGAASLDYGIGQGIFHFGVGAKHVQLSLGGRLDFTGGGQSGLDWNGQFTTKQAPNTSRAVLPQAYATGVQATNVALFHDTSGAFATVTFDKDAIYDLRMDLQPLARLLPPMVGYPALGLRWLDTRLETARIVEQHPFPGDAPDEAAATAEKRARTSLGTDDALTIGLRARVEVDWAPVVAYRYAELGLVKVPGELRDDVPLGFGLRAALARPETTFLPSVESFVMVGLHGEKPNQAIHAAASYSYSVPDATTYLPIPQAHVFGVQFVVGAAETSKPIVPIVRGLDEPRD